MQVEQLQHRFGHYPPSVHADQIYRTPANRAYCRERGIRLRGLPLRKPAVDQQAEIRQQILDDARVRNPVEDKFGQGKLRFSLGRVMTKLASTSATSIGTTFLVMNLEQLLLQFLFVLFQVLLHWWQSI